MYSQNKKQTKEQIKMKTYFKYVMLLFVAALTMGFTSCSDDDDDPASLVGTWQQYDEEYDEYYQITFKADGTMVDKEWDAKSGHVYYSETGRWQVKGDYLEMVWGDDEDEVDRVKFVIKGNKLIFDPGTEDEDVFTRV